MNSDYKFQKLDFLPPYGPMYIPVTRDGEGYYREGFVVKFYRNNGQSWVANFEPGHSKLSKVYDLPETNFVVIIAGGIGYLMHIDHEKPNAIFGDSIDDAFQAPDHSVICIDQIGVTIIDKNAEIWTSERIFWDGYKDLKVQNDIISGLSYDPTNELTEWTAFSFNITTREITGGSFKNMVLNNPNLEMKNKDEVPAKKKPKWKFWK
ncbi:hypothetical protein [Leeuwenhoekiella parthenopeia]|uniref:Uncharacterized protein n=1 Tax=Leeuwenhoekiella parthenopeia TaxID=2890320 RepID=A0ABS8GU50_9FLAO|nr:hypothetical protein [Leeuwenhoekiella parthenopeia]MCC4213477.1 hypothetical protein [Leeuwenhoekiella parthenopeia]